MDNARAAELLLRIGLAFVFIYAAISALVLPDAWIGFYPEFVRGIIPDQVLLYSHSFAEIILAFWLLSGWKTFWAAGLSAVWLFGIILGTLGIFLVTFRDVAIFFSALALALLSKESRV